MLVGQPIVNKVKKFLPFSKLMKRPQTKFHVDTMSDSKVIRSKKVKIFRQVKIFLQLSFLFIDVLLKLQ